MKRLLSSFAAVLTLSSCGMYTNIPAQVFVASVKPANLIYQKPDADGFRAITMEAPEVTLRGEPGSIGATFSQMKISYFKTDSNSQGLPSAVASGDIAGVNTFLTVHVPSSNFPSDPGANPMDVTQTGKMIQAGTITTSVPVVTRHVEDYGMNLTNYANAALTAEVIWTGTDDAGFPTEVRFHVPITFNGPAGNGK